MTGYKKFDLSLLSFPIKLTFKRKFSFGNRVVYSPRRWEESSQEVLKSHRIFLWEITHFVMFFKRSYTQTIFSLQMTEFNNIRIINISKKNIVLPNRRFCWQEKHSRHRKRICVPKKFLSEYCGITNSCGEKALQTIKAQKANSRGRNKIDI